jgi:hypothetical protein
MPSIYNLFNIGSEKLVKLINSSGGDVLPSRIDCILNVKTSYNIDLPIHPVEDGNVIGDHAVDRPVEIVLNPLFSTNNHFDCDSIFKTLKDSREKLRLVSPTIDQSNLIIKSYTIDESFIDANLTSINIVLQEVKSARVKYSQTQPYPAQGSKPKSASQVKKPMTVAKKPDKIGKITSSDTSTQKADEAKKKMSVAKKITSWLGQ